MSVLFALLAAGLGVLVLEGVSWALAGLSASMFARRVPDRRAFFAQQSEHLEKLASNQSVRARIHPVLGWEYGTGTVSDTEHLNAQGLRAAREYAQEPPSGVTRIAVFGDSYVYCNEVGDADSWPGQIEGGWNTEVLNYGVGGYGTDQAYLRFREEGAQFAPRIVILGFTSMMATRVVSRYRRFQDPQDGPWFKPRFLLDGDRLRLLEAPVASRADAERLLANPEGVVAFGKHDFWYHPAVFEHWLYPRSATYRLMTSTARTIWQRHLYRDRILKGQILNPTSEAFQIIVRIYRDFAADARARGAEPLALMLPARGDVELYHRTRRASYDTLAPRLEHLGMTVIDPLRALTSSTDSVDDLFAAGGHYSPRGNAIVAEAIADALHLAPRRSGSIS
jgi:hypothetical protein